MYEGKIVFNKKEAKNIYLLGIEIPKNILKKFQPGQFLKIKINQRMDPLIPRPFTIHAIEENIVYILYQIVGKGTKSLSKLRKGEVLEFLGPLGKPFPKLKNYIICAGGIGIAGFGFLLQKSANKRNFYPPETIFYGARTKEELARLSFLKRFGIPVKISTDDGSKGYRGFVTDMVEEELKQTPRTVLACGPKSMLKRVAEIGKKYKVKTYLVMETFLACGTGFCMGCVIPLKRGKYAHLCIDGPTFLAEEIALESLS
ncbi:MAG: dihydroorotate dehydrogenase electron transfer subunit [Thermodesulfobacterium sp.]|nr:dihydroorotate dehydrogenase electron transfer subunit [Thermodesulfobacterium sp.]